MDIKWSCGKCNYQMREKVQLMPIETKICPRCGAEMIYPPLIVAK